MTPRSGSVPIRSAWDNTIFGTDSTIKTWVTWLADDGSSGGSLWTWSGTARNGEPFELIGVNLDDYDENGLLTYSLVDWPYPAETVEAGGCDRRSRLRTPIVTYVPLGGTRYRSRSPEDPRPPDAASRSYRGATESHVVWPQSDQFADLETIASTVPSRTSRTASTGSSDVVEVHEINRASPSRCAGSISLHRWALVARSVVQVWSWTLTIPATARSDLRAIRFATSPASSDTSSAFRHRLACWAISPLNPRAARRSLAKSCFGRCASDPASRTQ